MIELILTTPPLHLEFDRTKWNGDAWTNPYELREVDYKMTTKIKKANPPHKGGRHPFNILTEEIYDA